MKSYFFFETKICNLDILLTLSVCDCFQHISRFLFSWFSNHVINTINPYLVMLSLCCRLCASCMHKILTTAARLGDTVSWNLRYWKIEKCDSVMYYCTEYTDICFSVHCSFSSYLRSVILYYYFFYFQHIPLKSLLTIPRLYC